MGFYISTFCIYSYEVLLMKWTPRVSMYKETEKLKCKQTNFEWEQVKLKKTWKLVESKSSNHVKISKSSAMVSIFKKLVR